MLTNIVIAGEIPENLNLTHSFYFISSRLNFYRRQRKAFCLVLVIGTTHV